MQTEDITNDLPSVFCWVSQVASSFIRGQKTEDRSVVAAAPHHLYNCAASRHTKPLSSDETTSHSIRLSKDDSQVAGYALCHPSSERGSTLIISLIIMILLMLLGVTAMNTSDTQYKMAANLQFENVALNNAETTINTAEAIASLAPATPAAGSSVAATDPFAKPANANNYLIEFVSTNKMPLASANLNCSDTTNPDPTIYNCLQCLNTYLITSQGAGGRGATKFIQTYYSVPHC